MNFDYNNLKSVILKKYTDIEEFCRDINISKYEFERKLNNIDFLEISDIKKIIKVLNVEPKDVGSLFFLKK